MLPADVDPLSITVNNALMTRQHKHNDLCQQPALHGLWLQVTAPYLAAQYKKNSQ